MIGYYDGTKWVGRKGTRTGIHQFEPPILVAAGLNTARTYIQREAFKLFVQPTKFRVTIGNWNALSGAFVSSDSSLNKISMWIGETALDGSGNPTSQLTTAGVQIPCATTLSTGNWLQSDWIPASTFALRAGSYYSLDLSWGVPGGKMASITGAGCLTWEIDATDDSPTTLGGQVNPGFGAAGNNSRLFRFIEYQVDDGGVAPSIFMIGNSANWYLGGDTANVAGTMHTWHQEWCKKNAGFEVGNVAFSTALATGFDTPTERWQQYNSLVDIPLEPDMVMYLAVNSSDLANITTPTATDINNIKATTLAVAAAGKTNFPDARHIWADIPPRDEFTNATADNARLAINDWMHQLPTGIDECVYLDYAATDGASPARMKTGLSTDGTHPSVLGNRMFGDMMPVRQANL